MMNVVLPVLPNYVTPIDSDGNEQQPIAIEHLSEAQLLKIAELWTTELIHLASKRRSKLPIKHKTIEI